MITDFFKGVLCGFCITLLLVGLFAGLYFSYQRDKQIIQNFEVQNELQIMRQDYSNRSADEFLNDNADVRTAADRAINEFERKRNEAMERIRSRRID
ncbi:hypothetical protein FACS1894190_17680 [Spirochaetia bacterium]|nr:hypothetical protein FACS1894190_17680 [Spirochaetia bacterium]